VLNQFEHFVDKGGRVNFSRFCADVFYGWPLIAKNVLKTIFLQRTQTGLQLQRGREG